MIREEKLVLEVSGTTAYGVPLPATGTVVVSLNSEELPEMSIPVILYRKTVHSVRFSPQHLAFGVARAGATVRKVIAIELPKSGGYAVETVEPSGEAVSVAVEENPKTPHVVLLHSILDASTLSGKIEQELQVTIITPGGVPEVYKLPISGFVKTVPIEPALPLSSHAHAKTVAGTR